MNSQSKNVPAFFLNFAFFWVPQRLYHFSFYLFAFAVLTCSTVRPACALEIDYDEMATALKNLQIEHSSDKSVTMTKPCEEITDKNVGLLKGISKKTKHLESVSQVQKFNVAFCSPSIDTSLNCAPDSMCKTVYKWQKALTKFNDAGMYVEDEILVPTACMCFLSDLDDVDDPAPVIIL